MTRWFMTLVHQLQFCKVMGAVEMAKEPMKYDPKKASAGAAAAAAPKKESKPEQPKKEEKKAAAPAKVGPALHSGKPGFAQLCRYDRQQEANILFTPVMAS